jgi:8-oxo-dGTP diphosphatase
MSAVIKPPGVGLGVILEREGRILLGERLGWSGRRYSIPGGMLDAGESFEEGARREIKEETDLDLIDVRVIAITNNLTTYRETGVHHISVVLFSDHFRGELRLMEPEKCAGWSWHDPRSLPEPHFEASLKGVACFLSSAFYMRG